MRKHSYPQAEKFLLSREFFGMKLGLENISQFLDSIDSPQNAYRSVHVAGTNGKGSTCAMIASVLQAQGYRVGLYTSPHLVSFRERVQVNGSPITERAIQSFVDRYRGVLVKKKLSFFEVVTALAFEYFRDKKIDIAVIEVGLGGRLDATNVLTPILTVCTDISFDHVEILGKSIPKIASEKAGIIKPDVPHLIGMLPRDAEKVMRERCQKVGARMYKLTPNDFSTHPERFSLDFTSPQFSFTRLKPSLIGTHQLTNAALALKALAILKSQGITLFKEAVKDGMVNTEWPGRFQLLKRRGQPTYLLDVCHNAGGAKAFVESYRKRFPKHRPAVIVGLVKRKDHQKMFDSFWEIARRYMLVKMKTHRTVTPKELAETVDFKGIPYWRCADLDSAIKQLLPAVDSDDIIVIVGSHYLVGEFLQKHG